jgi:cell division protein FtsA
MHGGEIIAGLDIGTTKVVALIASYEPSNGAINLLGVGTSHSEGLRRGVVVNIDKTVRSIRQAIEQAEQQAGIQVEDVIVGIAGEHIESFATRSIISIPSPTREISQSDVNRIMEDARNVKLNADRHILHVIPQDYAIDGQDGVTDPVGMSGVRMEANIHVVTALITAMQNLERCVNRAGLNVKHMMLQPLASSNAVLDRDEKEVGVALIDIGGGTTDIAVFEENIIRYTSIIPIAGNQITDDICKGLGILQNQAERIKCEYGHATAESIFQDEKIMIPGISGRTPLEVDKSLLAQIIGPRMEEIFEFCFEHLRQSGYLNRLSAGVVITGGSALLQGTEELAARILGMPVKLGVPTGSTYGGFGREVENPIFATAVGLILEGIRLLEEKPLMNKQEKSAPPQQIIEDEPENSAVKPRQNFLKRILSFFDEL